MKENLDEKSPCPRLYQSRPCHAFTIPVYVLLPPYNFFAGGFMLTGN